ncbi:hypothetical protein HTT03_09345 [Sulfitobacter sp. S0837]|nr:hypothetical protein [Sulfitobacter maritimus]
MDRGTPIGALCCISPLPRQWDMQDVEALAELASIADDQLQLDSAVKARVKAKLLAEKAVATRASFLAHANHEVRTPLSAISGASHLLKALATEVKVANLASVIKRNTTRLQSLTRDFLRISAWIAVLPLSKQRHTTSPKSSRMQSQKAAPRLGTKRSVFISITAASPRRHSCSTGSYWPMCWTAWCPTPSSSRPLVTLP